MFKKKYQKQNTSFFARVLSGISMIYVGKLRLGLLNSKKKMRRSKKRLESSSIS